MEKLRRVTHLPDHSSNEPLPPPPNPASAVQSFVGEVMSEAFKPLDLLNLGAAKLTNALANALPSFPAVRLFRDLVLGWPHSHPHPPTFGFPLPSIGPVIVAGAVNVLINGLPAARCGDIGIGAWCGGYFPLFEVFTGSSHVFIGGARPARQLIDFTKHCLPSAPGGASKLTMVGKLMMGLQAAIGISGAAASLVDQANYESSADAAEDAAQAQADAASATASGLQAAMTATQT